MTAGEWIAGGYGVVFRDGRVWLHHQGDVWTWPLDAAGAWQSMSNLGEWERVADGGQLLGRTGVHPREVLLINGERVRVPALLAIRTACACTPEHHCDICRGEHLAPIKAAT